MELGREEFKKLLGTLDRIAVANEKLIELATEERIETIQEAANVRTPGFCPHCKSLNPRISNEGGTGDFNDFVLVATCGNCSRKFIAIPEGWQVFTSPEQARQMMEAGNGTS